MRPAIPFGCGNTSGSDNSFLFFSSILIARESRTYKYRQLLIVERALIHCMVFCDRFDCACHLHTRIYIENIPTAKKSRILLNWFWFMRSKDLTLRHICAENHFSSTKSNAYIVQIHPISRINVVLLVPYCTNDCTNWRNGCGENRCACFYSIICCSPCNKISFTSQIPMRRNPPKREGEKISPFTICTLTYPVAPNRNMDGTTYELRTQTTCVQLNFMNGRDRLPCA